MSRKFNLEKEPYEPGEKIFSRKEIVLKPGVTVLVGCNGSGKSSLIKQLCNQLKSEQIPYYSWDDRSQGGQALKSSAALEQDYYTVATLMQSSEGESIMLGMSHISKHLGYYINNKYKDSSEYWILLDSIDSGFSIDQINDLKQYLFDLIQRDHPEGMDIYIVVSANEYEMVSGEQCFNVQKGKYVTFESYEDYKKFILESRKLKQKREENFYKYQDEHPDMFRRGAPLPKKIQEKFDN